MMNNELQKQFIQARQLHEHHQLAQAIEHYKSILQHDPNHHDTLHFLGLAYAQSGDFSQGLTCLLQALAIKPEAGLWNNLGNIYKKMQHDDKAINAYQQALSLDPEHALSHNNLASLYAQQNQYQPALQHYVKAVHAAPDFCAAHFNLGLLLLRHNELDAAKTQFNNVLALNPQAIDALFYLGVLHLEHGALDDAEQAFHQVLESDSEQVQALVNLGVIALKREQHQLAVDYFSKALALDNHEIDARNNLAATFMHHDRFENALMHYDVLLQQDPHNIEYLYNSGVAQMALGHLNEATIHFDKIIELQPQHTAALNNLAAIYLKLDMRNTSRDYLQRAVAANPNDSISQHMLHAINGDEQGNTTPDYAKNLFNNYALYYDQHMSGALNYTLPIHIGRTLHQQQLLHVNTTLDLGCGTGLTGVVLREISGHLTGVDLAEKMLLRAKEKGIYDQLVQEELIHFLHNTPEHYDLIVVADVFPYFGDLEPIIQLISQKLTQGGMCVFSTEINTTSPWKLEVSARFSHQPEYVMQLCARYHLQELSHNKVPARIQNQQPLHEMLYCVSKRDR